jgi:hypothetical protein
MKKKQEKTATHWVEFNDNGEVIELPSDSPIRYQDEEGSFTHTSLGEHKWCGKGAEFEVHTDRWRGASLVRAPVKMTFRLTVEACVKSGSSKATIVSNLERALQRGIANEPFSEFLGAFRIEAFVDVDPADEP